MKRKIYQQLLEWKARDSKKVANLKNTVEYLVDVPVLTGRSWTGQGADQDERTAGGG